VSFDALEWATASDGEATLVLATTKEALEAAPDFEYAVAERVAPAGQPMDQSAQTSQPAPADRQQMAQDSQTATPPPASATEMQRPDFTAMQPAPVESVSADNLMGTSVYGANDE